MKKPYKKPFVAFTILAFVMLAAFVACLILNPLLVAQADLIGTLQAVYFNPAVFTEVFKFSFDPAGGLLLTISWILAAVIVLLFLVMLFVAIFGIKKKPGAKVLGIVLAVFGMALGYFGGTVAVHNAYFIALYRDAVNAQFIGFIDHIQAGNWLGFGITLGMDVALLLFVIFAMVAIINAVKYARCDLAEDKEVIADELPEPTEEPAPVEEPVEPTPEEMPVFIPEPEDEPVDPANLSTTALAAIIKDIVREIVRDELERNNLVEGAKGPAGNDSHTETHSVVGATFGGPLIVQYFNGGIQGSVPAPAPAPVEEPAPAPVEEKKEEPAPFEEPAPVVEEPAPAPVEPAPVEEKQPKAPIIRIPFEERLLASEKELQETYSELKNEILSYGVKSRVSSSGDTFRLHRKTYVKMTVAGKSLKLYFALNPEDYRDSPIPVQDAGEKSLYEEIPLVFKVKSPLSIRRCKQLIQDVMEKDGLEQGEIGTVNWIKELKAEMKARKAEKK